jgi:hypothetical protein
MGLIPDASQEKVPGIDQEEILALSLTRSFLL